MVPGTKKGVRGHTETQRPEKTKKKFAETHPKDSGKRKGTSIAFTKGEKNLSPVVKTTQEKGGK